MAIVSRTVLKSYFETGDKPTEAQFIDLIDSLFHLTGNDSDDIIEGTTKRFMTSAEKTKLASITEVVADIIDTGALTAGVTKEVTHNLDITTDSTILIARDDSDNNNVVVALLKPYTVNSIQIKSNVNLTNLKVKIIGLSAS